MSYLCNCTTHTLTINIIINLLFFYQFNIEGTQYSLDDKLYHMDQAWDLSRIATLTIIDIQIC
jgi:hypothetical protein